MQFNQTLMETLGMELKTYEKELVEMTMPVDGRTHQPFGFLHGGANVALAESAASIGSFLHIDPDEVTVFGMEINANHIKSKRDGTVTAKASPIHVGKATMVWAIRIVDENDTLLCISRCTMGVVPKKR
ncbi:MAG TPA: hotdog fold thioesterase [Bacillota bacterium]|nr:hotdog fold thioesterase [Bacillota bacterium]